ncbi:Pterin-4-alpha-carbinolamine dehydratase 2, mitochondrial [Glycine max]|nr:Pterin-4-alpha-carbinolamine dehydratase 2, mitochondrial [Glycine max]
MDAKSRISPTRLTDKKCVPCNLKELRPMSEDAAHTLMPQRFTKEHGKTHILPRRTEIVIYFAKRNCRMGSRCSVRQSRVSPSVPAKWHFSYEEVVETAEQQLGWLLFCTPVVLILIVAEWNLVNEDGVMKLRRSWAVKTFTKGLEFFRIVAVLAENEGHHPDLHLVGWNNVTIEIWTHAVGGLTENDFILAAKIDKLDVLDLLRRKPSD